MPSNVDTLGPFHVVGPEIDTGISLIPGDHVRLTATGTVDFGGAVIGLGAPKLGPDGDNEKTPSDYPAPHLRKNSLICRVGTHWYQGGSSTTFGVASAGNLVLAANDGQPADNSRGWAVTVQRTRPVPDVLDPVLDGSVGPGVDTGNKVVDSTVGGTGVAPRGTGELVPLLVGPEWLARSLPALALLLALLALLRRPGS